MSSHYTTEPPPTATVLLHTSVGPITLSLFATQTPLTCRNFLQHLLDGYYDNTLFHRVVPGFVVQTGDPTGTGEGGESIYDLYTEDTVFDEQWARICGREKGERVKFQTESHSRLRFNRRGLVGMARSQPAAAEVSSSNTGKGEESGGYGSQFFITLADCRAHLEGKCTMFGRVEGEGIYNVIKIAEGELAEGTDRPVYPAKILRGEVLELPKGEAWQGLRRRERVEKRTWQGEEAGKVKKKIGAKKKGGKALLSFGGDEGEDGDDVGIMRPKKAKYNTSLIEGPVEEESGPKTKTSGISTSKVRPQANDRKTQQTSPPLRMPTEPINTSASPESRTSLSPTTSRTHRPSFHDPATQLPLRDPEVPSRSISSSPALPPPPPPPPASRPAPPNTTALNAEIAALKASMRRDVGPAPIESKHKKSALEQLIPETSIRGRKRPRPGASGTDSQSEADTIKMLNTFKAKLENADRERKRGKESLRARDADGDLSMSGTGLDKSKDDTATVNGTSHDEDYPAADSNKTSPAPENDEAEEETIPCDLHFIANCQSCSNWERDDDGRGDADEAGDGYRDDVGDRDEWMAGALTFAKDRLGKDLTWKKKTKQRDEEDLVVIDPREREREIKKKKKDEALTKREKGKARAW